MHSQCSVSYYNLTLIQSMFWSHKYNETPLIQTFLYPGKFFLILKHSDYPYTKISNIFINSNLTPRIGIRMSRERMFEAKITGVRRHRLTVGNLRFNILRLYRSFDEERQVSWSLEFEVHLILFWLFATMRTKILVVFEHLAVGVEVMDSGTPILLALEESTLKSNS